MKCLPKMYWIPKMHKDPIKARFIVASVKCTTKKLAKSVTSVLKRFYTQIENYHGKNYFFSSIKTFWCIQNKDPVLKKLNKISSMNRANSVSTFDFSTLYTKIPHDKLKNVMNELIDFCWRGCRDCHIRVTKRGAQWPKEIPKKDNNTLTFSKDLFKEAINFLISNCHFTVGSKIFRQIIGIPMGSDPSPFMANLFLFYYESKFLKELTKTDNRKARLFSSVFRYLDDLIAINDGGLFEQNYREIYPPELELKKENNGYSTASFLDLDIAICGKRFNLKL